MPVLPCSLFSPTRTVDSTYENVFRDFNFTIGNPDLVGGINRVRITILMPDGFNGTPEHVWRP